jgi:transcription elongation factor GreA-like protein
MTKILTIVRRSLRIAAKPNEYGSYTVGTYTREKLLNASSGRLVYVDGVVGKRILNNKQTKLEIDYFEQMKQSLMNTTTTTTTTPVDRRSKRIERRQRVIDGLNTTVKLDYLRTIRILAKTLTKPHL